ncbi:MAG: hemolysin family protein [bacterium]
MDNIIIIFVSILFSAYFSGMEIAFISANKLKFEVDIKSGGVSAKVLNKLIKSDSDFISTMLVGNNLSLVIYGIAVAALLDPVLAANLPQAFNNEATILIIQTIISSIVILVFAEFAPKTFFRINPNAIVRFFAIPTYILYYLLFPIIFTTIQLSEFILKQIFGLKLENKKRVFDIVDIDNFIKEFSRNNYKQDDESLEMQIFKNAIEFPEVKLRECMIPRTEIIALDQNDDLKEIRDKFSETGLSKILIYKDNNIDDIIGYVHVFDFFKNPQDVKSIIRPLLIVPETMLANKLLKSFIQQNKSIAVVVDEFGGTAGLITIEDIMEEIFGEIDDEYDIDDLVEKAVSSTEFLFSARLEIDYLNEKYGFDLPESDEYETLGGLITNYHESIPDKDQLITIENFIFKVVQVSETRIEQVVLFINKL